LYYPRDDGTFENVALALSDIAEMNQDGDYNAACIQVPEDGDVISVGLRTGAVTEGGTWQLTLESLDSSGDPGGMLSGDAYGSLTVGDNDDDTWFNVQLNDAVSVTRGQHVAVKVTHLGTDSGVMNLASFIYLGHGTNFPYINYSTAGGGAPAELNDWPVVALRYSQTDGNFPRLLNVIPASAVNDRSYLAENTDKDDEFALKFRLPFNAKVRGFWSSTIANSDVTVRLLNSSDSVLATKTFTEGQLGATLGGNGFRVVGLFSSDILVSRDTWYRLGYKYGTNQGAAQSPGLYVFPNAEIMDAMDGGADFYLSSRQRDGSWTDEETRRPQLALVISEIKVN
jgi:hypothetical protein